MNVCSRPNLGCRAKLAPGQWWGWCGETDMGQTAPALCIECGGQFKRADASSSLKIAERAGVDINKMQETTNQLIKLAEIAGEQDMPEAAQFLKDIIGARL